MMSLNSLEQVITVLGRQGMMLYCGKARLQEGRSEKHHGRRHR